MKRCRSGISEDSQFTTDENEVAGIITCFRHYWRLFLRWGAKRKRSDFQRDENSATHNSNLSSLDISASENHYELEHGGIATAPPPPPARRLQLTYHSNSKNVRAKNRPRKRVPKKKTHRELAETVVELSLEKARLIKEVEQMRKTNEDLKDCNVYMRSQLAFCLEKRQEQNMPSTPWSSSYGSDTRQKTETAASCDDFQRCNDHEHFDKCSGSSALGSAYNKLQRLESPMYPRSPESSFGSEKDGAIPTKDTVCSGFLDLNAPVEALLAANSGFLDLNTPHESLLAANSGFLDLNTPHESLLAANSGFLDLNTPHESLLAANSGFLDLNTPHESLFATDISNDLHDQMSMSKNKSSAAAEARRHRIELERGKYPQLRWAVFL